MSTLKRLKTNKQSLYFFDGLYFGLGFYAATLIFLIALAPLVICGLYITRTIFFDVMVAPIF